MSHWTHYNPVAIHSGTDALDDIKTLAEKGRWLLVTTRGFTRRGVTAKMQSLVDNGRLTVFEDVTPNPDLDHLDVVTDSLRTSALDGIIAVGGGSALDAAKVLAVTLGSGVQAPLNTILRGNKPQNWDQKVPLIAVPTTSGTGAEVTPFATVWDHRENRKYSVTGASIFPDHAILSPQLTLSLPRSETLYTALDAISHSLESLWNKNRTVISATYALSALHLANEALPALMAEPDDLPQRSRMQQASMLAGLAISDTRTAIAHAISYPMTFHYGMPHGLACSFTLPSLLEQQLSCDSSMGEEERQTLTRTLGLLNQLELRKEARRYLRGEDPSNYLGEMFQPDRAQNYSQPIDEHSVKAILSDST